HFLAAEGEAIKLAVQVVGDARLFAGELIRMNGIGKPLSGIYHTREVRHDVSAGQYQCDLTVVRDGLSAATEENAHHHSAEHKRRPTAVPGMLYPVEEVDRETGRTHITFRTQESS